MITEPREIAQWIQFRGEAEARFAEAKHRGDEREMARQSALAHEYNRRLRGMTHGN
jgi:hypothetical protein